MTARVPVKPTHRAATEIRRASAWWRANRPAAPFALADDLERALELVAAQPGIGARARNAKKEGVRRLLLSRTGYHLYYQVNAEAGRVEVLALWHSRRGRDPAV
ncbi:type II toxin-antitoxin system RelE/ParE family toxin [Myxococcota bacterium]|nr:type II toxin-antitoxin system RelE/ParE family toxin [Myxococcota bacterium]MCZ7617906.1 type II toxin-antitoxin system RelE/ParE family toxin [Myxococcota bacterium]